MEIETEKERNNKRERHEDRDRKERYQVQGLLQKQTGRPKEKNGQSFINGDMKTKTKKKRIKRD